MKFDFAKRSRPIAFRLLWVAVAVALVGEVIALCWRPQSSQGEVPPRLRLDLADLQASGENLATVEIQENQVAGLSYSRAKALRIDVGEDATLELLYLEYDSGNPNLRDELTAHPPQVCLANSGVRIEEVYPTEWLNQAGEEQRLQSVRSSNLGKDVYIFKTIWIPEWFGITEYRYTKSSRLLRAFLGMSKPPGILLMVGVHGATDLADAKEIFHTYALSKLKLQDESTANVTSP